MTLILSGTDGVSDIDGTAATPAIRGTDANTGIFFPAADTIAFAEGGAEAMRIDSSGNLGIGTTSPANYANYKTLTIQGPSGGTGAELDWKNPSGTTVGAIYSTATDFVIASDFTNTIASSNLTFTTDNTERMRINSSGNVGIGTTNPLDPLHVSTGSTTTYVRISNSGGERLLLSQESGASGIYAQTSIGTSSVLKLATGSTERMRIDSSGNVGIGTTSPAGKLAVDPGSVSGTRIDGLHLNKNLDAQANYVAWQQGTIGWRAGINYNDSDYPLCFFYGSSTPTASSPGTERMRITSGGSVLIGTTTGNYGNAGQVFFNNGQSNLVASQVTVLYINRLTNDGTLVSFAQDQVEEGTISVAGNTVSYNGFSGGHWTQLQEGRGYTPDIPRGTVMSSIGEMCEWKSVVWDEVIEHPATDEKDAWTETIPHRKAYLGQLPVGATFEEDEIIKTVVDDGNERLPKVKISDVIGDKAVYGVFLTYDEAKDMTITSLGASVVRIAAGVTVQIGDLLESNGDGCAKVQDDDVIRSKTIGKVTSITPSATYADGSYTVPAVLYCG